MKPLVLCNWLFPPVSNRNAQESTQGDPVSVNNGHMAQASVLHPWLPNPIARQNLEVLSGTQSICWY